MFIETAKIQSKLYKEQVSEFIVKGKSIIEFCETPMLVKNSKLTPLKEKELIKIIKQIGLIVEKLEDIKQELNEWK